MNIKKISLETGTGNFFESARKLFYKCGFKPCEPFAHYKKDIDASKITSDWFLWMHHTIDDIPNKDSKKFSWQKPHKDNKTGTNESYKPNKISKNNKKFKKYESWRP